MPDGSPPRASASSLCSNSEGKAQERRAILPGRAVRSITLAFPERTLSRAYRDAAWRVKLKSERKLVLLFLAERADEQGICFPSMTMIAEACDITKRGAIGIVEHLESAGLIVCEQRGVGRGNRSRYRLLLTGEKVNETTEKVNGLHLLDGKKVNQLHQLDQEKVQDVHLLGSVKGEADDIKGERDDTHIRNNRQEDRQKREGECTSDFLGEETLPGQLSEFECVLAEITAETSRHYSVVGRIKQAAKELQLAKFTIADLREFDTGRSRTSALNFVVRDLTAWRRDQARAPARNGSHAPPGPAYD